MLGGPGKTGDTSILPGQVEEPRNPVFTAMLTAGLGLALLAPNLVAATGLLALVAAIEIQVRAVEEPYLLRTHGTNYRDYASGTGRFLPGVGRLRGRSHNIK
ncbi:MAG: methyltransferase family protein [Pseudonocardiaceae bacterium]